MASGTIKLNRSMSSGSYIEGKVEWSAVSNPATNSSLLKARFYVRKGNTNLILTIPTEGTWGCSYNIPGIAVGVSASRVASVLEDWVFLFEFDRTIEHDADGSKSIVFNGYVDGPTGTSLEGHYSWGSSTIEFDSIPRPATIDSLKCSTSYLDGTITALYTPQYSGFYNQRQVYVNKNGALTSIRSTNLGTKGTTQQTSTINFSDDELQTIYSTVADATKATIRVSFKTFQDSGYKNQIGTAQYREITLSIPASVVPTVGLTITQKNSNAWIASKKLYVAGLSGVNAALYASPATGADIKSRSIICDGTTYDAASLNVTTLQKAGKIEFTAKVVDSRGRSATATKSIDVLPYSPPSVTSMTIERGTYDTEWTENENGEDLRVTFKTTLSLKDNGNTYGAVFEINGTAKTPDSGTTAGLASGASRTVYFRGIDGNVSHKLRLTATDSVGISGAATITVPTAHVTIEFRADGKGIAFGKTSEKAAFECAWPAHFGDAVYIADKITCPNDYSLRNFNINCNWADGKAHDMLVRDSDGLTVGIGWTGNAEDGTEHETVLDVRPKKANFRGTVTAPRGRFTATNDAAGAEQKDVALRVGDDAGQHIDMDTNEIQAKEGTNTPGPLYLNLDGGDVYATGFRIPEIQRGSARITPSAANVPTSLDITFDKEFSGTPTVIVAPYTAAPGTTVLGVGVNGADSKGCTLWVTRKNTTETVVNWIAVY